MEHTSEMLGVRFRSQTRRRFIRVFSWQLCFVLVDREPAERHLNYDLMRFTKGPKKGAEAKSDERWAVKYLCIGICPDCSEPNSDWHSSASSRALQTSRWENGNSSGCVGNIPEAWTVSSKSRQKKTVTVHG